jgi:small redox-active disulfide protein 2
MTIQILGTGCPKCNLLEKYTHSAINQLGFEVTVEKIVDMETIMEMGMLVSPGFAVDGELVTSGRVLSADQITRLLTERHTHE